MKQKKKMNVSSRVLCMREVGGSVWVGTNSPGKELAVFNRKGKLLRDVCGGHSAGVTCIAESNEQVWTASTDGSIRVWSLGGEEIRALHGHGGSVYAMTPVERHVWSSGAKKAVVLWDSQVREMFKEFQPHMACTTAILHLPDKQQVWTAAADGAIRVWYDLEPFMPMQ